MKYSMIIAGLLLILTTHPAFATSDNNPTNFKIRDVFDSQRLLVTDGLSDTYIETDANCTFSSDDLHDTIIVPEAQGHYLYSVYEPYPEIDDTVTYHGQSCLVTRSINAANFMRFKVKTNSETTVTGVLDNGDLFRLTFNPFCEHYSFELDDYVYIWSTDYYPGNTDSIYIFEPSRFSLDIPYHSCSISLTEWLEHGNEEFPPRMALADAKIAKRKVPESNRQNYISIINRTRDVVNTDGWRVVNSEGLSAEIPAVSLKTNVKLKLYSGTGTNVTDSVLEQKVYLGRKRKTLFHQHVDWIQIQDEGHKPIATYYMRYRH